MENEEEGIIKYSQEFIETNAPDRAVVRELLTYRLLCFENGWIGALSDGTGYGNISCRATDNIIDTEFFISGTQTGHLSILTQQHIAVVNKSIIEENKLICSGLVKASSESLTHAGIYKSNCKINSVIHIHNKDMWEYALQHDVQRTSVDIPYGTVEMSNALIDLVQQCEDSTCGIIAMEGHEDGIIAWGLDFPQAIRMIRDLEMKMKRLR